MGSKRRISRLIGALLFSGFALVVVLRVSGGSVGLRLYVFDVGQGDAIFLETPTHEQMLIDGGPSDAVLEKLGRAMPFWDRTIDVILLTHPDADHLTGLVSVLERYRVGRVVITGVEKNNTTYGAFVEAIQRGGVSVTNVREGDTLTLSSDAVFSILAPSEPRIRQPTDRANTTSIIGRLDYQSFAVLFTGDSEKGNEDELLSANADLDVDVLKVGHHGSRTSTSQAFLEAASPEIALISVGRDNSYSHPHQDVLDRLISAGARILRTDTDGDIVLFSDGESIRVSTGLGFRAW